MKSANDIIEDLGIEFAEAWKAEGNGRRKAWEGLLTGIARNLATLTASGLSEPLRSVVAMMSEVDGKIERDNKQQGGNQLFPLDKVSEKWVVQDGRDA